MFDKETRTRWSLPATATAPPRVIPIPCVVVGPTGTCRCTGKAL